MDVLRKIIFVVSLLVFSACFINEKGPCAMDRDCNDDGLVCEDTVCVRTCDTDADCDDDDRCSGRANGDGLICFEPDELARNTNNRMRFFNFFMIADTTSGDGCGVADPGSDLQFVRITDADGTATLGYAEVVASAFGTEENDFIDTSVLNGNPPAFDGECADDFLDTSVVAMGCRGKFIMRPLDGSHDRLILKAGEHAIEVGEYGDACGGSAEDTYEVFGCEDTLGASRGDVAGCTTSFGQGSGLTLTPVF